MIPLEVNLLTVPHLKALSSGIESFHFYWYGRTFPDSRSIWKVLILLHTEPSEQFVLLLFVVLSIIILSPFFPMSLSPRSNYSTSLEVLIGSSKIISKLSKQVQTCQNWPNLVKICLNGLKKSKFFQSVLTFQSWCNFAQIVLNFFVFFSPFISNIFTC